MKRLVLCIALLSAACASERLTGPAAQEAVAAHQSRATALADVVYFLDGKEISAKEVETLDSRSIESIEVLKGEAVRRLVGTRPVVGIVFIASKSGTSARR